MPCTEIDDPHTAVSLIRIGIFAEPHQNEIDLVARACELACEPNQYPLRASAAKCRKIEGYAHRMISRRP